MPINNYEGDTFVAFLDIAGFRELMQRKEAWKALDTFYEAGYHILRNQNQLNGYRVEGLFVSDSGILFVRNTRISRNSVDELKLILGVIKQVNQRMLENSFMLTTSIAYGKFKYQERIEFPGIEKNPIYGNAYVSAFLDNENGSPKIQPGQCRIITKNLPLSVTKEIELNTSNEMLKMIKQRDGYRTHFYYYWMVKTPIAIEKFEQAYKDAYNLKFAGMLKALKGC